MTGSFYWKIALVVIGGINVAVLRFADEVWTVGPGDEAPRTAKLSRSRTIGRLVRCALLRPTCCRSWWRSF